MDSGHTEVLRLRFQEAPVVTRQGQSQETNAFLEKVRHASGDIAVSIMLNNARYQHCRAVIEKGKRPIKRMNFLKCTKFQAL